MGPTPPLDLNRYQQAQTGKVCAHCLQLASGIPDKVACYSLFLIAGYDVRGHYWSQNVDSSASHHEIEFMAGGQHNFDQPVVQQQPPPVENTRNGTSVIGALLNQMREKEHAQLQNDMQRQNPPNYSTHVHIQTAVSFRRKSQPTAYLSLQTKS